MEAVEGVGGGFWRDDERIVQVGYLHGPTFDVNWVDSRTAGAAVLAPRSLFWSRGQLLYRREYFFDSGNGHPQRPERAGELNGGESRLSRSPSARNVVNVLGITARLLSTYGTDSLHRAAALSLCMRTPYRVVERRGTGVRCWVLGCGTPGPVTSYLPRLVGHAWKHCSKN